LELLAWYIFRGVDNGESGSIDVEIRGSLGRSLIGQYAGELPGGPGHLFALALPAGRYSFSQWNIKAGAYTTLVPRVYPDAKFNIESGKATYVGDIHMEIRAGENIIGIQVIADAIPSVLDRRERDIPMIIAAFPMVKEEMIRYEILDNDEFQRGEGLDRDVYVPIPINYK
jgi:hypothetical protein